MSDWINAWPLLIILAIGIAIGRWIERRRAKRAAAELAKTNAALQSAVDNIARGDFLKRPHKKP